MKNKKFCICCVLILILTFSISHIRAKNTSGSEIIGYETYVVQKGDCISLIAEKYKPKYMQLKNYIVEIQYENRVNEYIVPGDELKIPKFDK